MVSGLYSDKTKQTIDFLQHSDKTKHALQHSDKTKHAPNSFRFTRRLR
jgi:hypothetical protein